MINDIFDINKFNIIEDDNCYYFFRALNNGDYDDINNNLTFDGKKLLRVRTDLERFGDTPKYSINSEISLEEVYDHVKWSHRKDTNCLSLTTNANVALTYGKFYYHDQYLIIGVKKEDFKKEKFYFAGQYMIEECYKIINKLIEDRKISDNQIDFIDRIDKTSNREEIFSILKEYSKLNKDYSLNKSKFYDYYTLNEEQNLEKDKLIAKIDIINKRILFKNENHLLFEALKFSFTSSEVLHYKTLDKNMAQVFPITMDLFSLLQQAKTQEIDNEKVKKLELKILDVARKGYSLKNNKYGEYKTNIEKYRKPKTNVKISDVYKLTNGQIPYTKAYKTLIFSQNVINSKLRVNDLCDLFKEIIDDKEYDNVINEINEKCYVINPSFVSRNEQIGKQLSDSICLSITTDKKENITALEQDKVLNYINSLSKEDKIKFIENNGLENESTLCDLLDITYNEDMTLNEYYAEVIVDNLNLDSIYKGSHISRVLTKEERKILLSYFKHLNCQNMVDSLESLNLDFEIISNIIFNLVLSDGFKNINLIDFSNSEEFKDIMSKNISNINLKLNAYSIDRLLGIEDDYNIIPNTEIKLKNYQEVVFNRVNKAFETKRYSGVVLPTGTGKSFIAMSEMMRYRNDKIVYFTPNIGIQDQIKKHILKYICNYNPIPTDENEINDRIKVVFPYLDFYCYQGLASKERKNDEQFYNETNAALIIFDEAHRTGANEWSKAIEHLIESNDNAKVLAITATPVRDVDNHNMIDDLAILCNNYSSEEERYTEEELNTNIHYAENMDLIEAIQNGFVLPPKIITFDFTLKDSEQFKSVKKMYEEETNPIKKKEYEIEYNKMIDIVSKSEKEGMSNIIKKAFDQNKKSQNGRYIVFLPRNYTNLSTEEYFKSEMLKAKDYFKDIDIEPEMDYLSSSKSEEENRKVLNSFEGDGKHLKLLFAIDMINEGIHLDKIDGVMMLRPLSDSSKITYSQQLGRVINAIDKDHKYDPSEYPVVFDVYNNYLYQNMDREVNTQSSKSDLQRLIIIKYWIDHHKRMPDINSTEKIEYQNAFTLKKIQSKYKKYIDIDISTLNLSDVEKYEITEILNIGMGLELWDIEIPKRTIEDGVNEENFDRVTTFEVKGEQKEFIELFKKICKISKKFTPKLELLTSLELLSILAENDIELSSRTIKLKEENKPLYYSLNDLLSKISNDIRESILNDCNNSQYSILLETDVNRAIQCSIIEFYLANPVFDDYDVFKLRRMGIFENLDSANKIVDDEGFIIKGPKKFIDLNIYTGKYREKSYLLNKRKNDDNKYTKFDKEGNYCYKSSDVYKYRKGTIDSIILEYKDGMKVKLINPKCEKITEDQSTIISVNTGHPYDLSYHDKEGNYYKLENGVRVKTNSKDVINNKQKFIVSKIRSLILSGPEYRGKEVILGFDQYNNCYEFNKNSHISVPFWARVEPSNTYDKYLNNIQYDSIYFNEENKRYFYQKLSVGIFQNYKIYTQKNKKNQNLIFDKEGYVCDIYSKDELIDAPILQKIQPETKISKDGFDMFGNYYELLPDGSREKKSKSKYDDMGFDINGNNKYFKVKFLKEDDKDLFHCTLNYVNDDHKEFVRYQIEMIDKDYLFRCNKDMNPREHTAVIDANITFDLEGYFYDVKKTVIHDRNLIKHHYNKANPETKISILGIDVNGNYHDLLPDGTRNPNPMCKYDDFEKIKDGYEYKKIKNYIEEKNKKIEEKEIEKAKKYSVYNNLDENGFDKDGFYYNLLSNGERELEPSGKKTNPMGFDKDGNYHRLLEDGFREIESIDGSKIIEKLSKKVINLKRKYTKNLLRDFDEDGYHYEFKDSNYIKKEKYDSRGFDIEGFYYELQPDGTRVKTNKRYNEEGYDYKGFNQDGIHYLTGLKYDQNYFDKDGYNIITNDNYSIDGYDIEGFKSDILVNSEKTNPQFDIRLSYSKIINSMPRKLRCIYIAEKILSTPYEEREKVIQELKAKYEKTMYPLIDEEIDKNILAGTVKLPSLREKYLDEIKEIINRLSSEKIKKI